MTARPERVGVLFLGCGRAAAIHSRVLRRLPGVELHYASRDGARAEAHRRRFGGRRAHDAYERGLADPAVSVAVVATPTASHRELALRQAEIKADTDAAAANAAAAGPMARGGAGRARATIPAMDTPTAMSGAAAAAGLARARRSRGGRA